jgi:hypothetical protein
MKGYKTKKYLINAQCRYAYDSVCMQQVITNSWNKTILFGQSVTKKEFSQLFNKFFLS